MALKTVIILPTALDCTPHTSQTIHLTTAILLYVSYNWQVYYKQEFYTKTLLLHSIVHFLAMISCNMVILPKYS